jgi:hypothetical protein
LEGCWPEPNCSAWRSSTCRIGTATVSSVDSSSYSSPMCAAAALVERLTVAADVALVDTAYEWIESEQGMRTRYQLSPGVASIIANLT